MRNSTFISLDSTSCDIVTHIMHIVQSAFSNIKTHSWHLLCLWMLEMYGEYDGLPSTQKVCSFKNIGKRSKLECGGRIRRWTVGWQWSIFFWRTMLQMYQKYRTIADDFWKPCAHYVQNIMRTLHMFLFARNVRHSFQKSSANVKVLGQAASQACLQMMLHMNQKIFKNTILLQLICA